MADLITRDASAGLGDVDFVAAQAGGDTAEAGVSAGGWRLCGVLLVNNEDVGPHTVTVAGVGPVVVPAATIGAIPLNGGAVAGQRLAISYDAVTALGVAAVHF
jgi:hypothetical protein